MPVEEWQAFDTKISRSRPRKDWCRRRRAGHGELCYMQFYFSIVSFEAKCSFRGKKQNSVHKNMCCWVDRNITVKNREEKLNSTCIEQFWPANRRCVLSVSGCQRILSTKKHSFNAIALLCGNMLGWCGTVKELDVCIASLSPCHNRIVVYRQNDLNRITVRYFEHDIPVLLRCFLVCSVE